MKSVATTLLLLAVAVPGLAAAQAPAGEAPQLPFADLWREIESHSHAQRGAALELEAARAGEARASHFRRPEFYLNGRYVNTTDPNQAFMSRLGQRQVESEDFQSSKLNQPGAITYGAAALGATLPLYDGGQGEAALASAASGALSAEHGRGAARLREYADAFLGYGTLLTLRGAQSEVEALQSQVAETLARYEVGSTANPVGYSGLLGLKSLALRLKLLAHDLGRQDASTRLALSTQAGLDPARWAPLAIGVDEFARAALPQDPRPDASLAAGGTLRTRSLLALAESAQHQAQAADSALRPEVGVFVEGNALSGDRGTGTAYAAGVFVRWNLYSPATAGAAEEIRLRSGALREQAGAQALADRMAAGESLLAADSLRESLALLRESAGLLDEQLRTSRRLFAAGTINALQLAEAYSKRIDTILAVLRDEQSFLQAHRTLILLRPEVPHGN